MQQSNKQPHSRAEGGGATAPTWIIEYMAGAHRWLDSSSRCPLMKRNGSGTDNQTSHTPANTIWRRWGEKKKKKKSPLFIPEQLIVYRWSNKSHSLFRSRGFTAIEQISNKEAIEAHEIHMKRTSCTPCSAAKGKITLFQKYINLMSSWTAMHSNRSTFVFQCSAWKCTFFPSKALTAHLHETIFKWQYLRRWYYQGIFSRTTMPGKLDTLAVLSSSERMLKLKLSSGCAECCSLSNYNQVWEESQRLHLWEGTSDVWFLIAGVNRNKASLNTKLFKMWGFFVFCQEVWCLSITLTQNAITVAVPDVLL